MFQFSTGTTNKKMAMRWLRSPLVPPIIDKILAPVHRGRWEKK
jgi:hypothetical protein